MADNAQKPELLQEEDSIRIEDLDKKIKLLEGYIQRSDRVIEALSKKLKKLQEKKMVDTLALSLRGGV